MALQLRRNSSAKVRIITTLMMVFALVAQPLYGFVSAQIASAAPASSTVRITGNTAAAENQLGWMFNRDLSTSTPYEFTSTMHSIGSGSLYVKPIGSSPNDKFVAENFMMKPISDVAAISYDFKIGTSVNVTDYKQFYMNVYANFGGAPATKFFDCRYNIVPTSGSTTSFTTVTFDPAQNYIVTTSGSSSGGTCPASPSAMGPGATIRAFALNLGDTSANDTGLNGYFDNVKVHTSTSTVYDFEPIIPTASDSAFVSPAKYVREHNTTDITAQIRVPAYATDVRFSVNDQIVTDTNSNVDDSYDNDIYKVAGAAAGFQWYRLQKDLSAGQYTVNATFFHAGSWHSVTGSSVVYSLDAPWAEYVIPQANQIFRPNDTVVRIKADDEFNQFKSMDVKVNAVTHTVLRAACDDKGDYVLCDVQGINLPAGTYTATATTRTEANNRVDNLLSLPFKIDATAPSVSNLMIENGNNNTVSDTVKVSANASDINGVESVNFYITAPRADGVCTGNGTKLFEQRKNITDTDGKYRVLLSNDLNGEYCITAVARDSAMNNSNGVHTKALFDNTDPNVTLTSPEDNAFVQGTSLTQSWSSSSADVKHYIYESYNNSGATEIRFTQNMGLQTSKTAINVGNAIFWWRVKAVDNIGNETWSELRKITVDNNKPTAKIAFSAIGDTFIKVKFNENINKDDAENAANYFLANWPGAGGSGNLSGHATVTYDAATMTSTVTFTSTGWSVSPEQKWGVRNVRDLAGNTLSETSDYSTPLSSPVVVDVNGTATANDIVWTWTANDPDSTHISGATGNSGISEYQYRLVKGANAPQAWATTASTTVTTTQLNDDVYTLQVRALDRAGNVSVETLSNPVTVDTTGPELTINTPVQNLDGTYRVSGTTTDVDRPIVVSVNGDVIDDQVMADVNGVWTIGLGVLNANTAYIITADAQDSTGNAAQQKNLNFTTPAVAVVPLTNVGSTIPPLQGARVAAPNTTVGFANQSQAATGQEAAVLGTQTTNENADATDVSRNVAAIEPSANGWQLFNLAWYWWVLIIAAIASILWWIAAVRRQNAQ